MLSRPLTVLPQPKRFSTCLNVTNKHTGESFSSDSALALADRKRAGLRRLRLSFTPAFVPINPTVYVLDSALLPCGHSCSRL